MKEKTLFGMLNDDYRELVLKEAEMKKVKSAIREKSRLNKLNESNKKHLKESVNINVSSDGSVNVNNDNVNINIEEQSAPIVTEPIPVEEPEVEETGEEIIEEGCKTCESCGKPVSECSCNKSKKEAEAIVKNPQERGELEFTGYKNAIEEGARELLSRASLEDSRINWNFGSENLSEGPGWTGVEVTADYMPDTGEKYPEDLGIKLPIRFVIAIGDEEFGAPVKPEDEATRFLQFFCDDYYDGSEPCVEKRFNAKEIPIKELPKVIADNLENEEYVKKTLDKISELANITEYRGENNITDSEKLKESDAEEIGEDVINSIVSKIAAEDAELADKIKEILSKDSEEPEIEEVTEEPLEECEISSYKVTRIAPNSNAYMLEAQTKDGLKYIIGKNFNETEKTLDEAEILDNKKDASNKFRSLLK